MTKPCGLQNARKMLWVRQPRGEINALHILYCVYIDLHEDLSLYFVIMSIGWQIDRNAYKKLLLLQESTLLTIIMIVYCCVVSVDCSFFSSSLNVLFNVFPTFTQA